MKKILIVDDNPREAFYYQKELRQAGYEVMVAATGVEALRKVDEEYPDLVILDIAMPGMNGIDALGRLVGKMNQLPVIIYTGYPQFKENFMTWTADAYLVKSPDLSPLKAKIRELLAQDRPSPPSSK